MHPLSSLVSDVHQLLLELHHISLLVDLQGKQRKNHQLD
jgi:hypothetical protein